jgi:hypothetical protein
MAEDDGETPRLGDAMSWEGVDVPYAAEMELEDEPVRSSRSNLWYVPLTAIVMIDIVLWRLAYVAPSPGRWIALSFALGLVFPAFPVAARCLVES